MQSRTQLDLFVLRLAAVFLIWLATAPIRTLAENSPPPDASLYGKAKAATVEVLVNGHLNGSGCFVDSKGLVITAAHVIEEPGRRSKSIIHGRAAWGRRC
jgi:hypothetical protein